MSRVGLAATITGTLAVILLLQVASAQLNPGTTVTGDINRTLNSKDTQVGTSFMLESVHTSNYDVNGATLYGHVSHVQRAGQGTPGKIELAVDKINARSGNVYKIEGQVTNVQVNTKSNAGKEALAAAGGALVGGLIGKGWGAIIGGAGGYLVAKNNKENVTIPQGSLVSVHISQVHKVNP